MIFAYTSDSTEQEDRGDYQYTEDGYDYDEPYCLMDGRWVCGYCWREMERWGERGREGSEGRAEERVRECGREEGGR